MTLAPDSYGIGVEKGNKDLLKEINNILIKNIKNKNIDSIIKKIHGYKKTLILKSCYKQDVSYAQKNNH